MLFDKLFQHRREGVCCEDQEDGVHTVKAVKGTKIPDVWPSSTFQLFFFDRFRVACE